MKSTTADRDARRAEVARLTAAGETAARIAERLDCTRRTVFRDRQALGIAQPVRKLTDAEIATARALLDDGASRPEVARTIGCDERTIRRRFPDRAWTPQQTAEHSAVVNNAGPRDRRDRHVRRLVDRRRRAALLHANGLPPRQIATTMHVPIRTVLADLRRTEKEAAR